jgi:hypothetical protein
MHGWLRADNNLQEGKEKESGNGFNSGARPGSTLASDQISRAARSNVCIIQVDILKPLTISLAETAELLDASIVRTTRDVCGFRLLSSFNSAAVESISVQFDIVEQFDGGNCPRFR